MKEVCISGGFLIQDIQGYPGIFQDEKCHPGISLGILGYPGISLDTHSHPGGQDSRLCPALLPKIFNNKIRIKY
jgi:hypothetical protein